MWARLVFLKIAFRVRISQATADQEEPGSQNDTVA